MTIELGKTHNVLVNRIPQKWTPLGVEEDPGGYGWRVIFRVEEEGKEPWTQVIQKHAFMRRLREMKDAE